MKPIYFVILGFVSLGIMACSSGEADKPDQSIKGQMTQLDKESKALIGSASCISDAQCQSIGFGHKPCGGFYSYRIYSDMDTDTVQLKSTVNQYNVLSREFNKKNNLVSNCMLLMQPELACHNQTCQIK